MTIVNQMTEVAPGHFSLFKKQCINSEGENINANKLILMFKKINRKNLLSNIVYSKKLNFRVKTINVDFQRLANRNKAIYNTIITAEKITRLTTA